MVTTIQVKETTKQLLDNLKRKEKTRTYDELLQHLIIRHKDVKEMFGFTKKNPLKWSKKDRMDFDEI